MNEACTSLIYVLHWHRFESSAVNGFALAGSAVVNRLFSKSAISEGKVSSNCGRHYARFIAGGSKIDTTFIWSDQQEHNADGLSHTRRYGGYNCGSRTGQCAHLRTSLNASFWVSTVVQGV